MKQLSSAEILGQNVQRLRQQQGLDTVLLAKKLGWSETAVQALEGGKLDLDLDSVDLLSYALKIAPQHLFCADRERSEDLAERRLG